MATQSQPKNPRVGSIIAFDIPNGRGRHGVEYKEVTGRVYIVTPTHLVCVIKGGSGARPYCVETYKLIKW